ncbi:MAG TPA: acetyl-CoA carboxylase biotin carboxylase subunit [Bacteroides sp.]|nr:acetyl-CoA carboxylase biotin carboxylase subunit [Bacteroides sp.]
MIKKVLIANRGEIAVRVIRSCREMVIRTVAVFSEADRSSQHVRFADEAYFIGPSPSNESYLVIDKIIEVAKVTKADAIHPGYGFLSENAEFSDRCKKEGIIFIGPSAYAISTMGNKITARETMINAGVPVVPGTKEAITDETKAEKTAIRVGLPVMIKASSGGGGKGMRMVKDKKDIKAGIRAAKSEAMASFGDDSVYIEKYIQGPHHIEFQILADQHGNAIHLCERECSVQRRHQKVIEESPSPFITEELREKMGEAAVAAALAVNYEGAGTIEFLVDKDRNYYFLEMNTRLQVEHPITEKVVGIDLVREQIRIASGEKLSHTQADIKQTGHAIECRIYAEDPDNNFMPSPGTIIHNTQPSGPGVRIDGYVYPGYKIPLFYDPMISKLITWAEDRPSAIQRMKRALNEYKITGVKTSITFLDRVMNNKEFAKGIYDTHFIDENFDELIGSSSDEKSEDEDIAIITAFFDYTEKLSKLQSIKTFQSNGGISPWKNFGRKKGVTRM